MKCFISIFAFSVIVVLTNTAFAVDETTWIGGFDAPWSDDSNWSYGEPGDDVGDALYAYVNFGRPVITEANEAVGNTLSIGNDAGSEGTVKMYSGDLFVGGYERIGRHGDGHFEQYDGFHDAGSASYVTMGEDSGTIGTYRMEGGEYRFSTLIVGWEGSGTFDHIAGDIVNSGSISIPSTVGSSLGTGEYNIYGGSIELRSAISIGNAATGQGTLNIFGHSCDITLGLGIIFGQNAHFNAVRGAEIKITNNGIINGYVMNQSTNESNLGGLKNLTVVFDDSMAAAASEFEVAGEDLGEDFSGFCGNFDIDTLVVGDNNNASVKLVDAFNNGNRGGVGGTPEALYVRKIVVKSGSQLDLNGLHLYCLEIDIQGTTLNGNPIRMWAMDIDGNGMVDIYELAVLADNWLDDSCICGDWCEGADFDRNNRVDFVDFALLGKYYNTDGGTVFYSENLDSDPGWTTEGLWAFGVPLGMGGTYIGNPDPTSGYTGDNVYGVNLAGDYLPTSSYRYLTTGSIDCTGKFNVHLYFKRWLNCAEQPYSYHLVNVFDGAFWNNFLWDNSTVRIEDSEWQSIVLDVSEEADNNPDFRIRWAYKASTTGSFSGWNIDDIELKELP
ncbi:MAG: hypothetical protein PHP01_04120 [Phycisphaerae bacterium]|nr:hypothetical protein [Phycisphaerae bacterium]